MRTMLQAELEDFDLDEEDFEAATDLAEQVQSMSEVVARGTDRSVPLAVSETAQLLATASIDEEIEEDVAAGQGPACAAGCSACCYIPVSATAADVASLLDWLESQPADVRSDVEHRLDEALPRVTGAAPRGVLACPILDVDAGTCRAYEARPLACRGCFSDDASQCVPGGTISAFVVPQVIARSAAVGVRMALGTAGHDDGCDDLIVALARGLGRSASKEPR